MAEFRIFRFDPDRNLTPHYDKYHVPVSTTMTVLEGLEFIFQELDPTLSYKSSGDGSATGACAMHINGRVRHAGDTVIGELAAWNVLINPLPNFPVLKDLVVDLRPLYDSVQRTYPFLQATGDAPEEERLQTPEEWAQMEPYLHDHLCGGANAACPIVAMNPEYMGPSALLQVQRWANDSRDELRAERLGLAATEQGVFRAPGVSGIDNGCPVSPDPAEAISKLRKSILWHKLTGK